MHEVLVNRLGGLSLPRKSVVRLTDRPDMTLDVYRGHKTKMQQQQNATTSTHTYSSAVVGWLVVLGLTALSDSISVYIGPSPKEREKEERKDR